MNDNQWNDFLDSRITPDKEIDGGRVFLTFDDSELFVEGTISCVVGPAKSRKTFAMSLLLEQLLNPSEDDFVSTFNGDILYFDTEMSERRIQMVSQRFTKPENITFFSIRKYSIKERYYIIEEAIKRLRPHVVVIDGFKELVADINDQKYATTLLNNMLKWVEAYGIHLTGVLHTNPGSDKPRGALGTEMINKASSVMAVATKGSQTKVEPMYSRDKDFNPFVFTIDADGKPKFKQKIYGV